MVFAGSSQFMVSGLNIILFTAKAFLVFGVRGILPEVNLWHFSAEDKGSYLNAAEQQTVSVLVRMLHLLLHCGIMITLWDVNWS